MQIEYLSHFVKAQQLHQAVVYLMQNLHLRGRPPSIMFTQIVLNQSIPYNFVANSFHTKKLCSRLSSSEVQFYTENSRFAILSPPLGA